ncbi:restriction endonuclease subunit S [Clostridium neuense]|uniref:Restriction endonuclease subunit S n=1 Tax=Clostridium neuense TaxID=1728934 RepID=A0ABW8TDQ1_9CLOT
MKKVREGYKMTELGEIPVDWNVECLENIAQRLSGHTPDKKISEYWNGDIPWISLKDTKRLDKRYISETTDYTTEAGISNSSAVILPKGTVVLSRDATVGKVGVTDKKMATSQHFINYVCGENLHNLYLYYDFCNRKSLFKRIGIGSTIKTIGVSFFKSLSIILPPIKEQRKIADILSLVDDQIEITDNLIEKTKELKKGVMQKLLTKGIGHSRFKDTEIGRIPEKWDVRPLLEVSDRSKENSFIDGDWIEAQYITDEGIRLIQTGNIGVGNFIDKGDKKFVSEATFEDLKCKNVEPGDILICRMAEPTGRACIVPELSKLMITAVDCTIVKVDTNRFDTGFINYFLNSDYNLKRVVQFEQGSTRKRISRINLEKLMIPIPKIEEQKQISSIISSVDDQISQYESKKGKLQELKKGLMQKLLTGKIRVKV